MLAAALNTLNVVQAVVLVVVLVILVILMVFSSTLKVYKMSDAFRRCYFVLGSCSYACSSIPLYE